MHNPGHIEDKLVNKWKKDEGSGLKGWLEENISKKGMKQAWGKAAEYQKKGMSKEVVPGITQGDLYSGLTAGTASTGIKVSKYIPSMLKSIILKILVSIFLTISLAAITLFRIVSLLSAFRSAVI